MPSVLQVWIRLNTVAATWPPRGEPRNSQFLRLSQGFDNKNYPRSLIRPTLGSQRPTMRRSAREGLHNFRGFRESAGVYRSADSVYAVSPAEQ